MSGWAPFNHLPYQGEGSGERHLEQRDRVMEEHRVLRDQVSRSHSSAVGRIVEALFGRRPHGRALPR